MSIIPLMGTTIPSSAQTMQPIEKISFTKVSQQLLLQVKRRESPDSLVQLLQQISAEELHQELNTDDQKKLFG